MTGDDKARLKQGATGSGLPVGWQGWALRAGYAAAILLIVALLGDRPVWAAAEILAVTVAFLYLRRARSEGAWRWRRGKRP